MIDMKKVKLTNGGYAIVDDKDFDYIDQWRWQNINGYARRSRYLSSKKVGNGKYRSINKSYAMHRVINNTPEGMDTDHINGNKLDNRRSNLRTATRSENAHNIGKKNNGSKSKLSGVQWRSDRQKWRSYICIENKAIYLGSYKNEIDAHSVYVSAKEQLVNNNRKEVKV